MIVLDVNVLVAAFMTGHPSHVAAQKFLRESLGSEEVAIPDVVWSGCLRTVTNPSIFRPPL
ncbi:MAG: PIN domain-containing protein [Propionibacteriaceae bacterium]|nr:PIN domain-containing protein [Propionibacteriaceae bacterium]